MQCSSRSVQGHRNGTVYDSRSDTIKRKAIERERSWGEMREKLGRDEREAGER